MKPLPRILKLDDSELQVSSTRKNDGIYSVHLGDEQLEITATRLPGDAGRQGGFSFVDDSGAKHHAWVTSCGDALQVRVDGHTFLLHPGEAGTDRDTTTEDPERVVAPMTGTIMRVCVTPGQQVEEGADLIVLSAMKMEHKLRALASGTVSEVLCNDGQTVDAGSVLVRLVVD